MNRARKKINWRFDRHAARLKFGYKGKSLKRAEDLAIEARESVCPSSTLDETSQCPMRNRLTCETIAAKILLVDIHLEERI